MVLIWLWLNSSCFASFLSFDRNECTRTKETMFLHRPLSAGNRTTTRSNLSYKYRTIELKNNIASSIYTDVHTDNLGWKSRENSLAVTCWGEVWRRHLNREALDIESFEAKQEQNVFASSKHKGLTKRRNAGCHDCHFAVKSPDMALLIWGTKFLVSASHLGTHYSIAPRSLLINAATPFTLIATRFAMLKKIQRLWQSPLFVFLKNTFPVILHTAFCRWKWSVIMTPSWKTKFTLLLSANFLNSGVKWLMAANGLGTWVKIFKDLSASKEIPVWISTGIF